MVENEKTQKLKAFQDGFIAPIRRETSMLFNSVLRTRKGIECEEGDTYDEIILEVRKALERIKTMAQEALFFID